MVNLSGCKYLTDSSIIEIAKNCKEVKHFNITRIPGLTETGLSEISKAGMDQLEYLNLYANALILDSGFWDLANSGYNKMQFLDFCGCCKLSDDSVI